jgi:hypothetical protein
MTNATMRKYNGKTARGGQTRLGGSVQDNGPQPVKLNIAPVKLNIGVQSSHADYGEPHLRKELEANQRELDIKKEKDRRKKMDELLLQEKQAVTCRNWFNTNIPDFALETVLDQFQRDKNYDNLFMNLGYVVTCWPKESESWIWSPNSKKSTHICDKIITLIMSTTGVEDAIRNDRNERSHTLKKLVEAYNKNAYSVPPNRQSSPLMTINLRSKMAKTFLK